MCGGLGSGSQKHPGTRDQGPALKRGSKDGVTVHTCASLLSGWSQAPGQSRGAVGHGGGQPRQAEPEAVSAFQRDTDSCFSATMLSHFLSCVVRLVGLLKFSTSSVLLGSHSSS